MRACIYACACAREYTRMYAFNDMYMPAVSLPNEARVCHADTPSFLLAAKRNQELQSFKRIDDSFRKIVIVGDDIAPWTDDDGISYLGLFQFL